MEIIVDLLPLGFNIHNSTNWCLSKFSFIFKFTIHLPTFATFYFTRVIHNFNLTGNDHPNGKTPAHGNLKSWGKSERLQSLLQPQKVSRTFSISNGKCFLLYILKLNQVCNLPRNLLPNRMKPFSPFHLKFPFWNQIIFSYLLPISASTSKTRNFCNKIYN